MFHATFDSVPVGIAHTAAGDGTWLRVNQTLCEMLGYTPEELKLQTFQDLTHPEDLREDLELLDRMLRGEIASYKLVKRYIRKDGLAIWARVSIALVRDAGEAPYVVAVAEDVTSSMQDKRALEESEERYRTLIEISPDAILVISDHRITYANPAAAVLFGAGSAAHLKDLNVTTLIIPDRHESLTERIVAAFTSSSAVDIGEEHLRRLDGTAITADLEFLGISVYYQGKKATQVVIRDVTERKKAEEALKHQATHDSLTGLPNRDMLRSTVEALLAPDHPATFALLLMDLDRFKDINDTFGHQCGDLLLTELGPRLKSQFGPQTLVSRLGGDEFAIVLRDCTESSVCESAERLILRVTEPFTLEGQSMDVGGSIGIVFAPRHGTNVNDLLRRADVAMYLAKRERKSFTIYDSERDHHNPERLRMMAELRAAIDGDQLLLHYQPKALLRTGEIKSVEALVRWMHPERGLIPPDQFIPLAERGGLITRLTAWVLNAALQQARSWRDSGRDIEIAVNLSSRSLHDQALIPTVEQALETWYVDPQALKLELTETAIMDDPEVAMETLTRIHNMGVKLSIDDFGTGYSSLGYLKRLPVDEIKIDRSFVIDMFDHTDDAFIVRSTVDLGHNLGLEVVAEGVENQRTWDLLSVLGCDIGQGYFLSRPVCAAELTPKLHRKNRDVRRR